MATQQCEKSRGELICIIEKVDDDNAKINEKTMIQYSQTAIQNEKVMVFGNKSDAFLWREIADYELFRLKKCKIIHILSPEYPHERLHVIDVSDGDNNTITFGKLMKATMEHRIDIVIQRNINVKWLRRDVSIDQYCQLTLEKMILYYKKKKNNELIYGLDFDCKLSGTEFSQLPIKYGMTRFISGGNVVESLGGFTMNEVRITSLYHIQSWKLQRFRSNTMDVISIGSKLWFFVNEKDQEIFIHFYTSRIGEVCMFIILFLFDVDYYYSVYFVYSGLLATY